MRLSLSVVPNDIHSSVKLQPLPDLLQWSLTNGRGWGRVNNNKNNNSNTNNINKNNSSKIINNDN